MNKVLHYFTIVLILLTIPAKTLAVQPEPWYITLNRELNTAIAGYGPRVSVYYENIEYGFTYAYNADKLYYSASLIKSPYVHYLYETLPGLNTAHTYGVHLYRGGGGIVKKMQPGTVLTEAELLEYSITYSDNAAFRMLINAHGTESFKNWVAEKGGNTQHLHNITGAYMTARDAAFFMRNTYDFLETPGERNTKFKNDLLNSAFPYIQTPYPLAHKYGLWNGAFHDMGIVYAESPYILVIMTEYGASEGGTSPEARSIFRDISKRIQAANDKVVLYGFN
jgi:beta-lactamase class A